MSAICIILTVLILVFVLMTGQYNDSLLNLGIHFTKGSFQISFLFYTILVYAFGLLSCSLLMLGQFFDAQSRYNKLKHQYEKTSLGADDADEKIKLLENKIQTLDAAIKSQINKEN